VGRGGGNTGRALKKCLGVQYIGLGVLLLFVGCIVVVCMFSVCFILNCWYV
jgi:hypothetical protein